MISVKEAKQIITEHCPPRQSVCVDLENAHGKILAEDIYSPVDMPAYPQSSMDGYAFGFTSYSLNKNLIINGEIAAGDSRDILLQAGEAIRIFTGAPVPAGADTVIMQEKVIVENNMLNIKDDRIIAGANVRLKGSEIKAGELALKKDSFLNPAAIGFLACIGIQKVFIYASPVVSIIITGNELQKPGLPLAHGQVYESNSFALKAALRSAGIDNIILLEAKDDLETLTGVLKNALVQSDLILLTGGVSVGDYDFVIKAAENCSVQKLFHRIKQKPGKPLYFGKKENKIVFGLPGNPSSVLTCFYQYVVLALQAMSRNTFKLTELKTPLHSAFQKVAGLTHFLKGYYDGQQVSISGGQESYRMRSFAKANCLVEIGEEVIQLNKGETVNVYLLPGFHIHHPDSFLS